MGEQLNSPEQEKKETFLVRSVTVSMNPNTPNIEARKEQVIGVLPVESRSKRFIEVEVKGGRVHV